MLNLERERFLVTGGAGFLGSHVVAELRRTVVTEQIIVPRSAVHDLRVWEVCQKIFKEYKPTVVINLAANVGGIGYNQKFPAELYRDNIRMGTFVMDAAQETGVKKYVSIGTVCEYPKDTPVPFKEENLWNGYPEETNAPYGLAKKMQLVQGTALADQYGFNFVHLIPVNLYGPGDKFDEGSSHVIPALIKKFIAARDENISSVTVWGTGLATREFLYVEDAARAIVLATQKYDKPDPVNIGSGSQNEISIRNLAKLIKELVEFRGQIRWDVSKPDGQPRRGLDVTKACEEFGFKAKIGFREGLMRTIEWYEANKSRL